MEENEVHKLIHTRKISVTYQTMLLLPVIFFTLTQHAEADTLPQQDWKLIHFQSEDGLSDEMTQYINHFSLKEVLDLHIFDDLYIVLTKTNEAFQSVLQINSHPAHMYPLVVSENLLVYNTVGRLSTERELFLNKEAGENAVFQRSKNSINNMRFQKPSQIVTNGETEKVSSARETLDHPEGKQRKQHHSLFHKPKVNVFENPQIKKQQEALNEMINPPLLEHEIFHYPGYDNRTECVSDVVSDQDNMWYLSRINRQFNDTWRDAGSFNYTTHDNGQGISVYVLDSGINLNHSEFEGRAIFGYIAEDALKDDGTSDDLANHGTPVASLIGGHRFGVAKNSTLISVKVFNQYNSAFLNTIIEGMEYIWNQVCCNNQSGIQYIVNMAFDISSSSPSLKELVKKLYQNNVTLITGAGDSRDGACFYTPAKYDEVIAVGNTNDKDEFVEESNWGSCVTLLAPGVDMRAASATGEDEVVIVTGTAYAGALVSGAAARILSTTDEYRSVQTPGDVRNKLREYSEKGIIRINDEVTPNVFLQVKCTTIETEIATTVETFPSSTASSTTVTPSSIPTPTPAPTPPTISQAAAIVLGIIIGGLIVAITLLIVCCCKKCC